MCLYVGDFFKNIIYLVVCRFWCILCWFAGFGELLLLLYLIILCSHLVITLISNMISEEQLKRNVISFKILTIIIVSWCSSFCRKIFILEDWRYRKWLCEGRTIITSQLSANNLLDHSAFILSLEHNIPPPPFGKRYLHV